MTAAQSAETELNEREPFRGMLGRFSCLFKTPHNNSHKRMYIAKWREMRQNKRREKDEKVHKSSHTDSINPIKRPSFLVKHAPSRENNEICVYNQDRLRYNKYTHADAGDQYAR